MLPSTSSWMHKQGTAWEVRAHAGHKYHTGHIIQAPRGRESQPCTREKEEERARQARWMVTCWLLVSLHYTARKCWAQQKRQGGAVEGTGQMLSCTDKHARPQDAGNGYLSRCFFLEWSWVKMLLFIMSSILLSILCSPHVYRMLIEQSVRQK